MRTRRALLDAVETIVAAEGPDAVTTTRVAAVAGVAVGTLYRYFADRDGLLLAAYDDTVRRVVAQCADALDGMPSDVAAEDAARRLLARYLTAAVAIPAHAGLLNAMRSIRPVADDQDGIRSGVIGTIIAPFLARYATPREEPEPLSLMLLNVLLGSLVDLYLMAPDRQTRSRLHAEIEAHMLLALRRAGIAGASAR